MANQKLLGDCVDFNSMTLNQADKERRFGRLVMQWGAIKDNPVVQLAMLTRYFFPIDIHMLGDDAYVYIGLSPLFRSLDSAVKDMDMDDVPFYMMQQEEDSGIITAIEMRIEKKVIKAPTKQEIKKHG